MIARASYLCYECASGAQYLRASCSSYLHLQHIGHLDLPLLLMGIWSDEGPEIRHKRGVIDLYRAGDGLQDLSFRQSLCPYRLYFYSPEWRVHGQVIDSLASDHLPMIALLELI